MLGGQVEIYTEKYINQIDRYSQIERYTPTDMYKFQYKKVAIAHPLWFLKTPFYMIHVKGSDKVLGEPIQKLRDAAIITHWLNSVTEDEVNDQD